MRKIKFRAWDGNKITYNISICDFEDLNKVFQGHRNVKMFMQFTGLKDKNGKEIYESDIVKTKYGNPYAVEYGHCEAYMGVAYGFNISHAKNHLEIIGNIYENPDLLNNK